MSATADDVAATTAAAAPVPDGNEQEPTRSADSAPAVTDTDESSNEVLSPVQKRIDELTRRRYDAERDRDYWREQAQRALPRQEPTPPAEAPAAGKKKLADFGYDEDAYEAYLLERSQSVAVKATREELNREQQATQSRRREAEFTSREQKFSKDLPDYFEVTRGHVPITAEMAETIKESELGPAIAYHLGKNPDVAASIAQLTPLQQARELGRLEAKLAEKPKPPQVSGAPPPAPKLAAANARVDKDPKDMSDAEFSKWFARKRGHTT
jgi:hypothetical protein